MENLEQLRRQLDNLSDLHSPGAHHESAVGSQYPPV